VVTEAKTVRILEPGHLIHWGMEGPKSSYKNAT
jgi:hypothetical protein